MASHVPPAKGPSQEQKFAVQGELKTLCTAALAALPEDEWPGSKERMEAFVKKVAADNQIDISAPELAKLAYNLRTNTGALVAFKKKHHSV